MKVHEILTRHPSCVPADATLEQAARQMKLLDVGMLPVCKNDRLIGSITDRDIVIRGVAQSFDPKVARVSEVMTDDMVWCFEDQELAEAAKLMEDRQVRRLPVVNRENRLIGILSMSDLAVRAPGNPVAAEVLEHVSTPPALI